MLAAAERVAFPCSSRVGDYPANISGKMLR
jgi:hypothetical protein